VLTGAALPEFSWMLGPAGTSGALGAGPRLATTKLQSNVPSSTQSHGAPMAAFRLAMVTDLARPVAVSAIHSSMPAGLVLVNDRRLPPGEKLTASIFAAVGTTTFVSLPSATAFSVIAVMPWLRCGPLVFGLIRIPARRSIGCDRSAIDGMLGRSRSASCWRVGLTTTDGSGRASRMSAITLGGSW